jgi:hypothetical protein
VSSITATGVLGVHVHADVDHLQASGDQKETKKKGHPGGALGHIGHCHRQLRQVPPIPDLLNLRLVIQAYRHRRPHIRPSWIARTVSIVSASAGVLSGR